MRRSILWLPWLLTGGLLVTGVAPLAAQSFQGGIRGAVRDANGVTPGVEVTLTNEATNIARATTSNEAGEYAFAAVSPGTYTLKAALTGFKTFESTGLRIGTQTFITLDVLLEVGAIAEEITVTGQSPIIETSNASTGEVLDRAALDSLPAPNRNAFLIAVTVPTFVGSGDPQFNRQQDQSGASLVSLGGGARRANNYLLDGVPTTDLQNRSALFPNIESLQEIKVQVHTYDAEMGRTGGGVFNATGRSGSNEWHGTGYLQNRPNWGAANNFFAKRAGIPKPQDTYYWLGGGSLGGPIIRNRTFFWVTTENYRDQAQRSGALIMPTDRERRGDFSQSFDRAGNLVVIYDPLTTQPDPARPGQFIRLPFAGNVIPRERISRVGQAIANTFPNPDEQRSGADGQANYSRTGLILSKAWQATAKGEHKFTDKVSLTGMYAFQKTQEPDAMYWDRNEVFNPNNFILDRVIHLFALNNIIIPGPTTVVSLRYGYYTWREDNIAPSTGFDLASLGLPSSFVNAVRLPKFPTGLIQGYGEIGGGIFNRSFGDPASALRTWYSTSVNGSLSKFVGRHTFKFGADYRKVALDGLRPGQTSGDFFFDRQYTQGPNPLVASSNAGSGFASLLLGVPTADPSTPSTATIATPLNVFLRYYAGYAQDDWRVSSNLTLNYGLRYEYETGLGERENRFAVAFDRQAVSPLAARTGLDLRGGLRYAGQDGFPEHQGNPSKTKFSPRLGVAWTLDDRTVVRSGYGIFWAPWNYQGLGDTNYGQFGYTGISPYDPGTALVPRTANGIGALDDPFPGGLQQPIGNTRGLLTGVGTNIDFIDQERGSPRVQQFSIDLQREVARDIALSVGYMGARGDDLALGGSGDGLVNINQLDPRHLALGSLLNEQVPNPFFGIADAGPFSRSPTIARGQLLRPFPQFGNVIARQVSAGKSRYHAVVLSADRRLTNGWGGRFSYTWSRLKDNQYGEANFFSRLNSGALPVNNYDLEAEYAYGLLDKPHRVLVTPTVELPFGEGKPWLSSGAGAAILGNWTITAIGTYESGFPVNVTQLNNNTNSFGGTQRPNRVSSVDPGTTGDALDRLDNYINPAAYAPAAPFTFGTAPRTDERNRTPFQTNWDAVFIKSTRLGGNLTAQFRLEFVNLFNTIKFANGPEARFGNPSFGRITQQAGFSRRTQLAVRIFW